MPGKSDQALIKVNELVTNATILDIGAGRHQTHTKWFREKGHVVDTVDFFDHATYRGDFNQLTIDKQYDVVWTSHCLEHQLNVNSFLKKCFNVCKEGGMIAVTVPPPKSQIVGGHVSIWYPGLVVYHLVIAGFDCSNAHIKKYDYNMSVIAYKNSFTIPKLVFDKGDLDTLNKWMPIGLDYKQYGHFEGDIEQHNW